jgi:hypothetical protein
MQQAKKKKEKISVHLRKEYLAVLSSLGDIKLYNATLECTANHSAHIYIHTMRSVFSFPLAKSNYWEA